MNTVHVHHVACVDRRASSMLASRSPRYLRVAAPSQAEALRLASEHLGDPEDVEWRVQRADGEADAPGVLAAA